MTRGLWRAAPVDKARKALYAPSGLSLRSRRCLRKSAYGACPLETCGTPSAAITELICPQDVQTNLLTSVTSWSYVAASLASIGTSAILHARGRREDGRFVGQWAPTFLGAAPFTRLFNRMLSR